MNKLPSYTLIVHTNDRFKNKCFNKDATSYLQQALDWNIFLVQSIFLEEKKKKRAYFHQHSSLAKTAVNSYTYLLIYFAVQVVGCNSPTLHSSL